MRLLIPILCAIVCVGAGCISGSGPRGVAGELGTSSGDSLCAGVLIPSLEARLARLERRQGSIEQLVRGIDATLAAQFAALAQETRMIREQLDAQDRWIASLARRQGSSPFSEAAADDTAFDLIDLDSTRAPAWSPASRTRADWTPGSIAPEAAPGSASSPAGGGAPPAGLLPGESAQSPPALGENAAEGGSGASAATEMQPEGEATTIWPQGGRPPDPPADGLRLYEVAYEDLQRDNYQLALINLRAFLDRYPHTSLADNAQYWIGEAYYVQGQFEVAIDEFRKVIDEHPGEDKEPAAYYKIALSFESLRDSATARRYLEFLIERFPQTREARLAREQLDRP